MFGVSVTWVVLDMPELTVDCRRRGSVGHEKAGD